MIHHAILDRALEVAWLDLALEIGRDQKPEGRKRMELALRDQIPAAESRDKTIRTLSRTWLEPPAPAFGMIDWARRHSLEVGDSRPLHIGALIATHPFFGDICAVVGREIAQHGTIRVTPVRMRLRERWGARKSIDVAVRAAIRTFRSFGVLTPGAQGRTAELTAKLDVPPILGGWLAHALLLSRGVTEIDLQTVHSAPEFFMLSIGLVSSAGYEPIQTVVEGGRRTIVRIADVRRQTQPDPEQFEFMRDIDRSSLSSRRQQRVV